MTAVDGKRLLANDLNASTDGASRLGKILSASLRRLQFPLPTNSRAERLARAQATRLK